MIFNVNNQDLHFLDYMIMQSDENIQKCLPLIKSRICFYEETPKQAIEKTLSLLNLKLSDFTKTDEMRLKREAEKYYEDFYYPH